MVSSNKIGTNYLLSSAPDELDPNGLAEITF